MRSTARCYTAAQGARDPATAYIPVYKSSSCVTVNVPFRKACRCASKSEYVRSRPLAIPQSAVLRTPPRRSPSWRPSSVSRGQRHPQAKGRQSISAASTRSTPCSHVSLGATRLQPCPSVPHLLLNPSCLPHPSLSSPSPSPTSPRLPLQGQRPDHQRRDQGAEHHRLPHLPGGRLQVHQRAAGGGGRRRLLLQRLPRVQGPGRAGAQRPTAVLRVQQGPQVGMGAGAGSGEGRVGVCNAGENLDASGRPTGTDTVCLFVQCAGYILLTCGPLVCVRCSCCPAFWLWTT